MNCIHFTLTTSVLVVASVPVCPSNNAKESAVTNTSLLLRSRRYTTFCFLLHRIHCLRYYFFCFCLEHLLLSLILFLLSFCSSLLRRVLSLHLFSFLSFLRISCDILLTTLYILYIQSSPYPSSSSPLFFLKLFLYFGFFFSFPLSCFFSCLLVASSFAPLCVCVCVGVRACVFFFKAGNLASSKTTGEFRVQIYKAAGMRRFAEPTFLLSRFSCIQSEEEENS